MQWEDMGCDGMAMIPRTFARRFSLDIKFCFLLYFTLLYFTLTERNEFLVKYIIHSSSNSSSKKSKSKNVKNSILNSMPQKHVLSGEKKDDAFLNKPG
jgi:hypothetical protein